MSQTHFETSSSMHSWSLVDSCFITTFRQSIVLVLNSLQLQSKFLSIRPPLSTLVQAPCPAKAFTGMIFRCVHSQPFHAYISTGQLFWSYCFCSSPMHFVLQVIHLFAMTMPPSNRCNCVIKCVSLPDFKLSANLLYLECVQFAVPEGPDCMLKVPRATQKPQRMLARPQAPSHQVHFLGATTFRGSSRPAREIEVKCTLREMYIQWCCTVIAVSFWPEWEWHSHNRLQRSWPHNQRTIFSHAWSYFTTAERKPDPLRGWTW